MGGQLLYILAKEWYPPISAGHRFPQSMQLWEGHTWNGAGEREHLPTRPDQLKQPCSSVE